jgi:hypothetical protein
MLVLRMSVYEYTPSRQINSMKLILIALGLLATTGLVYAACAFC